MNTHLTEAQVVVLQDLYQKDSEFRNVIKRRFDQEAQEAERWANKLKEVLGGSEEESSAPPPKESHRRGRPKGTTSESSKMGAVVNFLSKNPNSTSEAIAEGLGKNGVQMPKTMLNSYLYQLKKRGDVVSAGDRGARTYSAASKNRKAK